MHFLHNIAAANELALDVKLRNSWPVGKLFDAFPNLLICKHVYVFPVVDTVKLKDLDCIITETTSWHLLASLHE